MRSPGASARSWLLAGLAIANGPALAAQQPGASAQVAARPEDVQTLDGIIAAYYEIVSGPAGEVPDRARDHSIHHPDASIAITGLGADDAPVIQTMTLDGYHDRFGGARGDPFYEYEIHRVTQRFGNIAHVWSTYASSLEPAGEPFARGINSIQLYHDGDRWWITSWVFDSERAGNPIPPEFVP